MTNEKDGLVTKILPLIPDAEEGSSTVQMAPTADDALPEPILSDDELVNKAIENLRSAYQKGAWSTIINIGEIVISMVEDSKRMRSTSGEVSAGEKKVAVAEQKSATYAAIMEKFKEKLESLPDKEFLPKKTYIYNAVRLVERQNELSKTKGYEKLSVSHRICLLTVPIEKVKNIINQVVRKDLSVLETKALIKKESPSEERKTINYFIHNPSEIEEIEKVIADYSSKLSKNTKTKKKAIEGCKTKLDELESEINELQLNKKKIEALLNKIDEIKIEPKNTTRKGKTKALPDA